MTLVDDYGHHPREIEATLKAVREGWPERRIVMVYQPHRYTRTRDLLSEFAHSLTLADQLLLLEVYSAGEPPIPGADSKTLAAMVKHQSSALPPLLIDQHTKLPDTLRRILKDGDILLMQGAGNIGALSAALAKTNLQAVS